MPWQSLVRRAGFRPPSCKWTLHRLRLPQGHTYCHIQRQKQEMTESYAILTTLPVQICHRHKHPPKDVSSHVFSCTPRCYDNASHKSLSPSGDGVACFPHCVSLHMHIQSGTCKVFSSFQAHWEGGTKPEQSAHIGSPELPCQTPSLTIAPHQPLATNPGVSDTIPRGCSLTPHSLLSYWRKTGGHWLFP